MNDIYFSYWYIFFGIVGIVFFLSLFIPSANVFFHFFILRNHLKIRFDSKYYRDILSYSPSEILYIYDRDYRNNSLNSYRYIGKYKKLFYINLLKMYLLGYIKIDFTRKENFKIIKNDVVILDEEYKMIYDYIFTVITNKNQITLYEINDFVEQNYQNNLFFKDWHNLIIKRLSMNGFYSIDFITAQGDIIKKYYILVILFLVLLDVYLLITSFSFGVLCMFIFPLLVLAGYYDSKRIKIASNRSIYEYRKIKALKKFLKDFTVIDERPPEYINILNDYIVYASIFDMYGLTIEEKLEEIRLFLKVNN